MPDQVDDLQRVVSTVPFNIEHNCISGNDDVN